MKNAVFFRVGLMLFALIMFTSCLDQIMELVPSNDALLKSGSKGNVENKIRLLENKGLSDGFLYGYRYNEMGLANSMYLSKPEEFNVWATMEYDDINQMSKARFYYSEEVFYDIVLAWENGKLVKETWYVPDTEDVVDYYVNFYNKKGQLIKRDNPPYDFYTLFQYDNKGNLKSIEYIDYDGNFFYGIEFSYSKPVKNPFTAIPGMPVSIFFADWHESSPDRFTGLKYYYHDENGNQVVDFNWESAETEIRTGIGHYAVYQNSRDIISDMWTDQTWTYENSRGKSESQNKLANSGEIHGNSTNPKFYKFKHKSEKLNMKDILFRNKN